MTDVPSNWKLKLRYGRITTPYEHFTVIGDGVVGERLEGFSCPPGPALMTIKVWASDDMEAASILRSIAGHIGYSLTGKIQIYQTAPDEPPQPNPHAYDIQFFPYGQESVRH